MSSIFSSAFETLHSEYRTVESTFSSAFNTIHSLNIELWDRHSALHLKTFILNLSCCAIDFQLYIRQHTHFELSYGFDIQLCIRKDSFEISSCGIDIQLYIQQHAHFKCRVMSSTFSSAPGPRQNPSPTTR